MEFTLQPTDETADTGLQTTNGTYTDVAEGGFASIPTVKVTFKYTYQLDTDAASSTGTARTDAFIEYTTNDGGAWSVAEQIFSLSTAGTPPTDPKTESGTLTETSVTGNFNTDQCKMRVRGVVALTGDGTGDTRAQITDWELAYERPFNVILEG